MAKAGKEVLSIVYEEQDPLPTIAVGGAYGGPNLDGSLVFAHVYTEFNTIPSMEEKEIEEGKVNMGRTGSVIRRGDITRKVLATLVLSADGAISVGEWLAAKGKAAKAAAAKGQTKEPPK
jgi:hypothetical protein